MRKQATCLFLSCLALYSQGSHAASVASSASSAGMMNKNDIYNTQTPIKHLVVIFQENIPFDRYFGVYPNALNPKGEPVFLARKNTPQIDGLNAGLLEHNPNGINPYRLARNMEPCDQDHGYEAEQDAYNGGLVNQFVSATANHSSGECTRQVMGYYDGNTVTALWNYAQNYAMSDNSYGTIFGPSTPGALDLVAGMTGTAYPAKTPGIINGQLVADNDPRFDDCSYSNKITADKGEHSKSFIDNRVYLKGRNIGNMLDSGNITWGWFEGGFDPTSFKDGFAVCGQESTNLYGGVFRDYIQHHEPFQYYKSTSNPHHLPPESIASVGRTDQANHQYSLKTFWKAVNQGNLPAVSFLKATAVEDGHAGYSNPLDEQRWLVTTINRLEKIPQWKSTAIVIAYDDSDGAYDHVMPPENHFSKVQGRSGYGPRLPMLVISPYAKTNYVDHTLTDQSSIMKFIDYNWRLGKLPEDSASQYAGTIAHMLDFKKVKLAPEIFLNPGTGEVENIKQVKA